MSTVTSNLLNDKTRRKSVSGVTAHAFATENRDRDKNKT